MLTVILANMFTSASANIFTSVLVNIFTSNLANIFICQLEKCKTMIWQPCSLVKLIGEYVGLLPGIDTLEAKEVIAEILFWNWINKFRKGVTQAQETCICYVRACYDQRSPWKISVIECWTRTIKWPRKSLLDILVDCILLGKETLYQPKKKIYFFRQSF